MISQLAVDVRCHTLIDVLLVLVYMLKLVR